MENYGYLPPLQQRQPYPPGSQDWFEQELARRFNMKPDGNPLITPDDVRDLLPDLLRAHDGQETRNQHPMVDGLIRDRKTLHQIRSESGMTTPDFLSAMANSLSEVSASRFEDANADVAKICADTIVQNYLKTALPNLSMPEPPEMFEDSSAQMLKFKITEAARSGQLRQFGGKVRFSKAVWLSYGEFIAAEVRDYVKVFSLIETRLIAETLEAGTIETATSAPLTTAGLAKADNALRDQLNGAGMKCNLGISALVVPPELSITARLLKAACNWPELNIVVNNSLTSSTTWYCVANPRASGALKRLKLRNAGNPVIYSNAKESGPESGMSFFLEHSVDFVLSGAPGLVKCTA